MPNSLIKVKEMVFTRRQADGSALVTPVGKDVLLVNFGQNVSLEDLYRDGAVIESVGPDGVICSLQEDDQYIGVRVSGQLAKYPKQLAWMLVGGTYDLLTDVWTPPLSTDARPTPVQVKLYSMIFSDGENFEGDLLGYQPLILPKAKGRMGSMAFQNDGFTGGPFTLTGKEFVDEVTPNNTKPAYYFEALAATLPSAASYAQPFHCVESAGSTDLVGVLISVTVDGTPVTANTDASGDASLSLPYGVHTYTASKSGHTTQTGAITVGLVNDTKELSMVATG